MGRIVVIMLQGGLVLCCGLSPAGAQTQEEMLPETPAITHVLDIPAAGGLYSGVGAIHGWICEPMGELTIRFNGGNPIPLLYGAQRADVLAAGACDHAAVGFVTIWNWSELGDGEHTAVVYDGEAAIAERTFMVATFGVPFLTEAAGSCLIDDFPAPGETAHFTWVQETQHLELERGEMLASAMLVGLITKTDTNPFFVTMREAALRKAAELGVELRTFSGAYDGDTEAQIAAIESLVAAGAQGILITPSDPAALANTVTAARQAGVIVIALDTPFDPADTVDVTFTTDNFKAGELIGRWARSTLGEAAQTAKIATLDLSEAHIPVDVLRNQGFLTGFGVDIKDPTKMYDEDDARLVGRGSTGGSEEGGQTAMEILLRKDPGITLVYTINEPVAAGAYQALQAFGVEKDVLIVSIDGGCPGVRNVAAGVLGATAMQYPLRMAALGVEAVVEFVQTGKKPATAPGLDFSDTGVTLVTDQSVPGIPSISAEDGLRECWG